MRASLCLQCGECLLPIPSPGPGRRACFPCPSLCWSVPIVPPAFPVWVLPVGCGWFSPSGVLVVNKLFLVYSWAQEGVISSVPASGSPVAPWQGSRVVTLAGEQQTVVTRRGSVSSDRFP